MVRYYDSAYQSLSDDTEEILLQLFRPSRFNLFMLEIEIMKTPKQIGTTDCGLYAIAMATALANGLDPCELIFREEEMRPHLVDCLQTQKMRLFLILH
jgi:hypothetical protein